MKVLMLAKPGVFKKTAGDRIQIEQTAKHLKDLGVDITFGTDIKQNYQDFDLVHVFQLDWNPYCYFHILEAKKRGKPVVFSTIHHKVEELKRFDDEYVFDFRRISKVLFKDQFNRDLFKEFYKSIMSPSTMWVNFYALFHGLKNMYVKALKNSDVVLVQTQLEAEDLKHTFGVNFNWDVVKNGVGDAYLNFDPTTSKNPFDFNDYLICVGRIEPRKNQLSIIKAVELLRTETGQDFKLVLVGPRSDKKHFEYYQLIDEKLKKNKWIIPVSHIGYEDMPKYYSFAKVGISASWFETTGLTSLEALFCGTNAVASGDRAKQYLGDNAYYCDPGDIQSIKQAIKLAYLAPRPRLAAQDKLQYTWKKAAQDTFAVYNKVCMPKSI